MESTQKIIHLPRTDSALPRDLREDLMASLLIMAWIVEARDPYTGGHLWRVSRFSRLLAEDGGLPGADVARTAIGGFLHDLGKISTPDHILGKKGSLTEEEYEIIKTTPKSAGACSRRIRCRFSARRRFLPTTKDPTAPAIRIA